LSVMYFNVPNALMPVHDLKYMCNETLNRTMKVHTKQSIHCGIQKYSTQ